MIRYVRWAAAFLLILPAAPSAAQDKPAAPPRADLSRIRGSKTATTWFIIVGDLAGTKDRAFHLDVWPTIDSLFVRPGRLRVAWVNLPDDTSKASQIAAEVAACSASDRKFWSPHDLILWEQPKWRRLPDPTEMLVGLAAMRGARLSVMRECLQNHSMKGFLEADIARARGAGIRKAPGFIVGKTVLQGVRTPEEFRTVIERELAKQPPAPRGTKPGT